MMTDRIKDSIREVPDFPKKGIGFKDITTLLLDGEAFRETVDQLFNHFKDSGANKIVCIESRGFFFGAALAYKLGVGVIPVRKPGKLPAETRRVTYTLEYGTDSLEMHVDAISPGDKVLIIDDLLATGGTVAATCDLVTGLGGAVAGIGFVVELTFLNGRSKLPTKNIVSLVSYDSE
jgi:adenine phosphoribosyltransferase